MILCSKTKSDHCSSVGIIFKLQNENWLLFNKFLSDFEDFHVILMRIVSLTNLIQFSKSKLEYCSSNGNNFSVCHWISTPKLSREDDSSCHFFGGAVFSQTMVHQKALYRRPWQIWPRTGGYLGKNLTCIKTRAYFANIRITKIKARVSYFLQIFCAFMIWAVRLWKP